MKNIVFITGRLLKKEYCEDEGRLYLYIDAADDREYNYILTVVTDERLIKRIMDDYPEGIIYEYEGVLDTDPLCLEKENSLRIFCDSIMTISEERIENQPEVLDGYVVMHCNGGQVINVVADENYDYILTIYGASICDITKMYQSNDKYIKPGTKFRNIVTVLKGSETEIENRDDYEGEQIRIVEAVEKRKRNTAKSKC